MVSKSLAKTDPPKGKRGLGKAQFIAQIDLIKAALKRGWNAKDIWNDLTEKGHISIQYPMFTRYVNSLILDKKTSSKPAHIESSNNADLVLPSKQEIPEASTERTPIKVQPKKTKHVVRPENAKDVPDDDLY